MPRSLLKSVGSVPALNMHLPKARRTSLDVRSLQGSRSTPWHKQQMYVITYLLPSLSAGFDGPSMSIMTSCQHSSSLGFTATASCFVGRFLNLMHVRQFLVHSSTSVPIVGHHARRLRSCSVCLTSRCPPNTPTWVWKNSQYLQGVCAPTSPSGMYGTYFSVPSGPPSIAFSQTLSSSFILTSDDPLVALSAGLPEDATAPEPRESFSFDHAWHRGSTCCATLSRARRSAPMSKLQTPASHFASSDSRSLSFAALSNHC